MLSFFGLLRAVCVVLAAGLCCASAWASLSVEWAPEPSGGLNPHQPTAVAALPWAPLPAARLNAGYVDRPYWFRLRIEASAGQSMDHLAIDNPLLDEVRIHMVSGPQAGREIVLGAARPFGDRPVSATQFLVPISVEPGQVAEALVRVSTRTAMQVGLTLQSREESLRTERGWLMINGILFGVMLAMAAYNLCLWLSTRDAAYLWYVCWVTAMGLFSASVVGVSYEWLWPHQAAWNAASRPVLLSLAIAGAMMFARTFIGARNLPGHSFSAITALAVAAFAWALASWALPYTTAIRGAIGIALVAMVVTPLAAFFAWRAGSQTAGYYLLAWGFVVMGGMVLAAEKLGLLPSSTLTQHASQIGAAVESVVLSFALAARLNAERLGRERAQREVERSQAQAKRLEELAQRDALTGLFNRRRLDQRLRVHAEGGTALTGPLAVLMIDIDHFKRLNDTYGHASGDACIQAVARELEHQAVRHHAEVCRYGGEEFCMLAPMTLDDAVVLAEQLRAAIEQMRFSCPTAELQVTVSTGVAAADRMAAASLRELLRCADEALYQAKGAGRNCVVAGPEMAVLERRGGGRDALVAESCPTA